MKNFLARGASRRRHWRTLSWKRLTSFFDSVSHSTKHSFRRRPLSRNSRNLELRVTHRAWVFRQQASHMKSMDCVAISSRYIVSGSQKVCCLTMRDSNKKNFPPSGRATVPAVRPRAPSSHVNVHVHKPSALDVLAVVEVAWDDAHCELSLVVPAARRGEREWSAT